MPEQLEDALFIAWRDERTPDIERRLVSELRVYAKNLCYSSLGYEKTQDIANNCAVYVLLHPIAWTGLSKFRTWYHALVMNKVRDAYREQQDSVTDQLEVDAPALNWNELELGLLTDDIRKQLSDYDRDLFDSVVCGYTAQDIAERLGINIDTVYQRLSRMRSKVRELLGAVK